MPRLITNAVPIGSIHKHTSASLPDGYLGCDGSAISRTTYADLFTVIGVTYGSGDGSSTFNLPDFRGRHPVGDGNGAGLSNRTLGLSFGAETHTLASSNLPIHTHGVGGIVAASTDVPHTHSGSTENTSLVHSHGISDPGHGHSSSNGTAFYGWAPSSPQIGWPNQGTANSVQAGPAQTNGSGTGVSVNSADAGNHSHSFTTGGPSVSLSHSHSLSGSTDNGGFSNSSVNHMNPSLVVKFMIRY